MGRDMLSDAKYLRTVPFRGLSNWSVQYLSEIGISFNSSYPMVCIRDILKRNKTVANINDDIEYRRVTIKVRNGGVILRDKEIGKNIGTKRQFLVSKGQFILSKIDARNGAMGLVPIELEGAIVTQDFLPYDIDTTKVNPQYLVLVSTTNEFMVFCQSCSSGTTNRQRIEESKFLDIKIPLPNIKEQNLLISEYNRQMTLAVVQETQALSKEAEIGAYLSKELGIKNQRRESRKGLQLVLFSSVCEWGVDKILNSSNFMSNRFATISLNQDQDSVEAVFRGKSPKYDSNSSIYILNQKCIRWNNIELEWAKKVDENWIENIDNKFLTKLNDILINSTGEGTIGRSSIVIQQNAGLLYDSHVLLLRLNSQRINPRYFVEIFNSEYGQLQVNSVKSAQTTKQTELGVNNLLKIKIPLPSIEIQNEIAEYITNLKEQIKRLLIQATENRTSALRNFEQKIF